CNKIG
ncbi:hypothetical protein EfaecalisJ8_27020, partial [Enterococcus faecalis]